MTVPLDVSKCKDRAGIGLPGPDIAHRRWQSEVLTYSTWQALENIPVTPTDLQMIAYLEQ